MNAIEVNNFDPQFAGAADVVPLKMIDGNGNGADKFPLILFDADGNPVGNCYSKADVISLWNSTAALRAIGTLMDYIGGSTYGIVTNDGQDVPEGISANQMVFQLLILPTGEFNFNAIIIMSTKQPLVMVVGGVGSFAYDEDDFQEEDGLFNLLVTASIPNGDERSILFSVMDPSLVIAVVSSGSFAERPGFAKLTNLSGVDLSSSKMVSADIDALLQQLADSGVEDGFIDLRNQVPEALPGSDGLTAISTLEDNGWNVQVDS